MTMEKQISAIRKQTVAFMPLLCMTVMLLSTLSSLSAQKAAKPQPPIRLEAGRLVYTPDEQGNRVPDFSYCGYEQSELPIPTVEAVLVVPHRKGDNTARLQAAIDHVSTLIPDADGFRGAIQLEAGTYEVSGSLTLHTDGVVLRGAGLQEGGTTLLGTGQDRATLITIGGKNDKQEAEAVEIADSYVPVNSLQLTVKSGSFKVGDRIIIRRLDSEAWITRLGTAHFGGGNTTLGWKPGNQILCWERTLTAVAGNKLTLDAPLTNALDPQYGITTVSKLTWPGRISRCGVENLHLASTVDPDNAKDENHRWNAVSLENCEHCWVRRLKVSRFAGSAVHALETARHITVEDIISLDPVSEIGGYRRYTFYNEGQLNLFQRLYAELGYHDFASGHLTSGPNAFVQCLSVGAHSFSGSLGSWANGLLFDVVQVDGQALRFANRGQDGQGAGWTAANSVFWQCAASLVECPQPPTAQNWAFGTWGQYQGNGSWTESDSHVQPRSLYYAQLNERLGRQPYDPWLLPVAGEPSSSPTYEVAAQQSEAAKTVAITLDRWIDQQLAANPLPTTTAKLPDVDDLKPKLTPKQPAPQTVSLLNGWLVSGEKILTGKRQKVTWWSGNTKARYLANAQPHITRYVPGRTGTGLTDDLEAMTDQLKQQGVVALNHNYGLWYERRRDDHQRVRRLDGDVWAPFYEQPFARSGLGRAYDGLSRYDLTKWNTWYWLRLKAYADFGEQKGLLLFHQHYFQHNILEAGAHWTDCPWRTANNINDTPFPEPVNYAGDKRVFMAEQFYDLTDPAYRALHKNYIRQCLNAFRNNSNVVHFVSAEYTGPLSFVQFWLDVIAEWERETGCQTLVALSVTKDVQDAILSDPVRAALIDIIDTNYWRYLPGGQLYAPQGGQHLAPRQHERLRSKGLVSQGGNKPSEQAASVTDKQDLEYWTVRDYKHIFPDKAVVFASEEAFSGWPAFMAGASLCNLPTGLPAEFLTAAVSLKPVDPALTPDYWLLADEETGYIAYVKRGSTLRINLKGVMGVFKAQWLDARTGIRTGPVFRVNGGRERVLTVPAHTFAVLWLTR